MCKLFSLNQQLQVKLFSPVPPGPSSPVFVNIHPTRSLPSAYCFPITYFLGFFLLHFHSRKSPSQYKHWFSCFSSSYHQKISSFSVTVLPNLQKKPLGKVWWFFLPSVWSNKNLQLAFAQWRPKLGAKLSPDDSAEHYPQHNLPVMGNLKRPQANTSITKATCHLFQSPVLLHLISA